MVENIFNIPPISAGGFLMSIAEKQPNLYEFRDPEVASIEMIRRAHNLTETEGLGLLQRAFDEEDSFVAEGLKGNLDTFFDYKLTQNGLVAKDGELHTIIAKNGISFYFNKVQNSDKYEFLLERAIYEYEEAQLANKLANGEIEARTIISISAYPEEAESQFGQDTVQSLGFHPDLKRALVRAIEKTSSGVRIYTRSIDSSNLKIWNSIFPELSSNSTEELLRKKLYFSNGAVQSLDEIQVAYENRIFKNTAQQKKKSVWEFMKSRRDLTDHFRNELLNLSSKNLDGNQLKVALNKLRRDYWSAMKESYDAHNSGSVYMAGEQPSLVFSAAGAATEARGESVISCGMEIKATADMTMQELQLQIFGSKDKLECVKCPFCEKTVTAGLGNNRIECLGQNGKGGCGAIVDTKTGKRIDKKNSKDQKIIDVLSNMIIDLFFSNKKKTKN